MCLNSGSTMVLAPGKGSHTVAGYKVADSMV